MLKSFLAIGLLAITVAGCGKTTKSDSKSVATKSDAKSSKTKPPQMSAVKAEPITGTAADGSKIELYQETWSDTQKYVAEQKGKVVVVDFWATYCGPCKKEFPGLVDLHKKHGDKIACVSFSLDYEGLDPIEEVAPEVMKFLKSKNASFRNVLCSDESDVFYETEKLAAIPVVRVYDTDGKMVKQFEIDRDGNEFSYEKDIAPYVAKLIGAE